MSRSWRSLGHVQASQQKMGQTDAESRAVGLSQVQAHFRLLASFPVLAQVQPDTAQEAVCLSDVIAVSQVDGTAERTQALELVRRQRDRGVRTRTLAADKSYDVAPFVGTLREEGITPHVAAKVAHGAIDRRTTRHESYRISQRCRKRVEEIFGWMKTVGGFRRTRYRGVERTGLWGYFVGAAYNLVRLGRMLACAA